MNTPANGIPSIIWLKQQIGDVKTDVREFVERNDREHERFNDKLDRLAQGQANQNATLSAMTVHLASVLDDRREHTQETKSLTSYKRRRLLAALKVLGGVLVAIASGVGTYFASR